MLSFTSTDSDPALKQEILESKKQEEKTCPQYHPGNAAGQRKLDANGGRLDAEIMKYNNAKREEAHSSFQSDNGLKMVEAGFLTPGPFPIHGDNTTDQKNTQLGSSNSRKVKEEIASNLRWIQTPSGIIYILAAILILSSALVLLLWLANTPNLPPLAGEIALQVLVGVFSVLVLWNLPYRIHWLFVAVKEYRESKEKRKDISYCDFPALFLLLLNCMAQCTVTTLLYAGYEYNAAFIAILVLAMVSGAFGTAYPDAYRKTKLNIAENRRKLLQQAQESTSVLSVPKDYNGGESMR